ncbi:MAG: hypothetical protein ACPGGE_02435 [Poseidonia sp.]
MIDEQVAEAWSTIKEDLESFRFFWDMGDHVMYRKVATDIYNAAKFILDMVEIAEDVDDV